MMINKRLIGTVSSSRKYIAGNVILQWCSLAANILLIFAVSSLLEHFLNRDFDGNAVSKAAAAAVLAAAVRLVCTVGASRMSYLASRSVKKLLREKIYRKLLKLGASYSERVSTSEIVQIAVEGVDQLETYFGAYLPQFFYSMLAPLTLFAVLGTVSIRAAIVLLICVPLIPISIAAVQTFAKKLLAKYWGQYTELGDTFLENLQGLTTLKIYQTDAYKNDEMNEQAEKFRKITMKVLTMQLNSITIMDLVAYGGAALGVILAVSDFEAERITFAGCFAVILLSADFFLPMRQLGSYFHIAMNGMAASDKIFHLLDLEEPGEKHGRIRPENCAVQCRNLSFSYDGERQILRDVNFDIPQGGFVCFAGESGSGKSTAAAILMGRNKNYGGSIMTGGTELSEISEESLMKNFTYISHDSYLFKGTVRDNLQMGDPNASDARMWEVLEQTRLADFLRCENGLDTALLERAANLSGGQRQRLALARALLHDSPVYIFDEATSNIDVESENDIMEQICSLAGKKTVLLISHRLANCEHADRIYTFADGTVCESGTHSELLSRDGVYAHMWKLQKELEHYGYGGEAL